jgi:hypothetical protein
MVYGKPGHLDVGRDLSHAWSASAAERHGDVLSPSERNRRQHEAVHGGGVHGSGVWVTERELNDWHNTNSIKYAGPFHPEFYATPVPISHIHCGLHDATLDFKTAVRGIVPGYSGHVPRARDMYGEPSSGGVTPERGWKRAPKDYLGPMGSRANDHGPEGAASRPHAYTRGHNTVSDEIKPGYSGHVPVAREAHGTSFYRDSFTRPASASVEDGALSVRTTSERRFVVASPRLETMYRTLSGNATGWKSARAYSEQPRPGREAGLRERERMCGRQRAAPRVWGGKSITGNAVEV